MKIMVFGCGVIGSIYAVRFALAGFDVSVYARGRRLCELQEKGLLYQENGKVKKSCVAVTDKLNGKYEYVFVTVKNEQISAALDEVKIVDCDKIVTMVNNPIGYDIWEKKLGKGRLIPAFPSAGGVIENGILKAGITPAVIQKTTFGEIDGIRTKRILDLRNIFSKSKIPAAICGHMMNWQLCHLGLVVPLADAIYRGGGDNFSAGRNFIVMLRAAKEIRCNLSVLKKSGCTIEPHKMNIFLNTPPKAVAVILSRFYCSDFGSKFIYGHAKKAKMEMMTLRRDYYNILKERTK